MSPGKPKASAAGELLLAYIALVQGVPSDTNTFLPPFRSGLGVYGAFATTVAWQTLFHPTGTSRQASGFHLRSSISQVTSVVLG